ncbi:MAG: hypothetical protein AAGM22_21785 [Acidobacteriota bacterium]
MPSDTNLCLADGRFDARIEFRRPGGVFTPAGVETLTDETGYFWFFDPENIEVVLKVLDACGAPFDRFWVFAAGLTDVETVMTVTDTLTGDVRSYTNPAGTAFRPILDTDAFATCPAAGGAGVQAADGGSQSLLPAPSEITALPQPMETCAEGALCLQDQRFEATVTWATGSASGVAEGVGLTTESGYFWFFDAGNVEIVLKVLDACAPPFDRYWVFAAGLTDVDVTLSVRDMVTGEAKIYEHRGGGAFQPILDTDAFATCDAAP